MDYYVYKMARKHFFDHYDFWIVMKADIKLKIL